MNARSTSLLRVALVCLSNTSPEQRNRWDYPVELAAVWNFGS